MSEFDRTEMSDPNRSDVESQHSVASESLPGMEQDPAKSRSPSTPAFQFPIRGLMVLTLAIAVGMAGRNWLPAKPFAGLLTAVATIIIFKVELRELDSPRINPLTIVLFVACCAAIFVALVS